MSGTSVLSTLGSKGLMPNISRAFPPPIVGSSITAGGLLPARMVLALITSTSMVGLQYFFMFIQ